MAKKRLITSKEMANPKGWSERRRRYHWLVPALVLAFVLLGLLLSVAFAFWWQERTQFNEREVVYGVEDALAFVMARLGDESRRVAGPDDVRRILEWELRYLQDPALHRDRVAVVGGLEAAQFAQEQAMAQGYPYDGSLIIEVLDLQADYLAVLGAVGDAVNEAEGREIIERFDQDEGG
jgi:hypothetical protein